MNKVKMNEVTAGLAWGAGFIALALAASFARKLGYIEGDTVKRLVIGMNGLGLVWYGNRMPKLFVPNACGRQARRVAGWSMVLSGLTYAGVFAFAPLPVAFRVGPVAVMAGIAFSLSYCLWLARRSTNAQPTRAG